ncbi:MAG: HAD family phosphatase [Acidobacteria bacterium]|nr:HAD family phosphatase [Acidobacteriota bacterium]
MLKTLLFDLGNVIVPIDFSRCHAALAGVCQYPPKEIPRRIRATGLVERLEKGEVSPEYFVQEVSQALDMQVSFARFWEIWSSIFLPDTLLPEALLERLSRQYRMLLLSNTNAMHFEMVRERYPLLRHFDGYVLSYQVGALKPSPDIYREAIARAGCQPEECFFIDDVATNAEAARQAGMDAVQFENREQLEQELQARGVVW